MKKKNDTPEVAALKDKFKIALCGIIVVLLVLMEVYSMIHFNIVVDIVVGILIAIDVFFLITFALDLSQRNKEAERKEYQDLYKAQKASYLVIRKSFDELQNRIDMLEEKTAIPADEIITAQKAVAKVTISRSKENTDALMNSNDELINHLFSFEEKLDANNQGLIEKQEQLLDATREEILEKNNDNFDFKVSWGCDLQTEHERYLTEVIFNKPVFVTDYPKDIKAFYMKMNDDGKTVAAMDCLVPGIGEIIGGSQREDDYDKLLQRIKEMELAPEDYEFYLDLRKYGSARHAGFGLGFERCVMYLTGITNIRDVIPFPRTVNFCDL